MRRTLIAALCIAAAVAAGGCHGRTGDGPRHKLGSKQQNILRLYNMADSIYYKEGRIDTAAFLRFIDKAVDFATTYPDDEISPDMLYRAGVGSMIIAKASETSDRRAAYCKKAIAIFNQFQAAYPGHEKYRYCYYQRGVIYDDILGDYNSAEDQYREFINRYPDDPMSPDLEAYLKLLGRSDDEIGKMVMGGGGS